MEFLTLKDRFATRFCEHFCQNGTACRASENNDTCVCEEASLIAVDELMNAAWVVLFPKNVPTSEDGAERRKPENPSNPDQLEFSV